MIYNTITELILDFCIQACSEHATKFFHDMQNSNNC